MFVLKMVVYEIKDSAVPEDLERERERGVVNLLSKIKNY